MLPVGQSSFYPRWTGESQDGDGAFTATASSWRSPGDAQGLSCAHISTVGTPGRDDEVVVTMAKGGRYARVKDLSLAPSRSRGPGGKRGTIKGFSYASGARLRESVDMVDDSRVKGALWGTMTCPNLLWGDIQRIKVAWLHRLARRLAGYQWAALWRIEAHPGDGPNGGAPHLHVMIVFLDKVPEIMGFRAWNDKAWAAVTGHPECEKSGCRFVPLESWKGRAYYCGKYAGKVDKNAPGAGRMWGIVNRKFWPVTLEFQGVSRAVWRRAVRAMRKLQERQRERVEYFCPAGQFGGFSGDGQAADCWRSGKELMRWVEQGEREGPLAGLVSSSPELWSGYRRRVKRVRLLRTVRAEPWFDSKDGPWGRYVWEGDDKPESRSRAVQHLPEVVVRRCLAWASEEVLRLLEEGQFAADLPF